MAKQPKFDWISLFYYVMILGILVLGVGSMVVIGFRIVADFFTSPG